MNNYLSQLNHARMANRLLRKVKPKPAGRGNGIKSIPEGYYDQEVELKYVSAAKRRRANAQGLERVRF